MELLAGRIGDEEETTGRRRGSTGRGAGYGPERAPAAVGGAATQAAPRDGGGRRPDMSVGGRFVRRRAGSDFLGFEEGDPRILERVYI